jgi:TolA-binding protein
MNLAHWRILFPAAILLGGMAAPALAQRPLSPAERVLFLEQQLAASQAAAIRLEQRLGAIERQLQQLVNNSEVGSHRVTVLEGEIGKLRSDIESRISAIERRAAASQPVEQEGADAAPARREAADAAPAGPKPKPQTASASTSATPSLPTAPDGAPSDPGEDAYSIGFRLWRDGKYDQAITALRAFTSAFPKHRRVSFANNLIGRALLDDGKPRPAAEALLANYRADPKGERAPDSLYYLGQALMRLDQPSQACKAFAELESVYGSSIRNDLKSQLDSAKAEARCS